MFLHLRSRLAISFTIAILVANIFAFVFFSHFHGSKKTDEVQANENEGKILSVEAENQGSTPTTKPVPNRPLPPNSVRLDWFKSLDGSPDVRFPLKYARRDIVVRPVARTNHSTLTKFEAQLLPDFQHVESFDSAALDPVKTLAPLTLEIPVTPKPDASHILLGSASTLDRIRASIPFFERWLPHTGARLIIVVVGHNDKAPNRKAMAELELEMRDLGMEVTLVPPLKRKDTFIQRYFSLVKILYEHRDEKTRWLGFVDDDTFFVSMTAFVERLATFDHTKEFYLGALSEDWWTVLAYGLVGMGGAGVFLTIPTAESIVKNYQDCRKHTTKIFGDHIIYECIMHHTETRLTSVNGLYQIDLHGDRSGVFESGRIILTLHHWKEGYWSEDGEGPDGIRHPRWFPMDKMALVQDVCGDTCFLQRLQFGTETILTNGYSIASYPTGALRGLPVGKVGKSRDGKIISLDQIERTWSPADPIDGSANDGYDHYLGPGRAALKLEVDKIHWRLMEARKDPDGSVRQYFRRVGRDGRIDEWVELHFTREEAYTPLIPR